MKQLFKFKSRKPLPQCVIYEVTCVCNETYIGEIRRNAQIRWNKPEDPKKESEPAKHLRNYPGSSLSWKMLLSAPANNHVRKVMKASMIALIWSAPTE